MARQVVVVGSLERQGSINLSQASYSSTSSLSRPIKTDLARFRIHNPARDVSPQNRPSRDLSDRPGDNENTSDRNGTDV
jgi:capsule polysaccharide export protein KpsC/LpsZ